MSGNSFDVAVIGGGPAGGMAAWHIAKAGFGVAVIEEHGEVGEPVQCAGLVSPRCLEAAGVRAEVIERLSGADFHSPSGKVLGIGSADSRAVVIDRAAFDSAIMGEATDSGAALFKGARVRSFSRGDRWSLDIGNSTLSAKLLIGADGPSSMTRQQLGLGSPEFVLRGFQADVRGLELPDGRAQVFAGREVAPNFFAWAIPAGDEARVGLCVRDCQGTPHSYFERLFESGPAARLLAKARVAGTYAGTIPLGTLPSTHADAAMLVGDAACQVKATSGGGLYPGIVCARRCAETAVLSLEAGDVSAGTLRAYDDSWRGEIGDELRKALMIHRVIAGLDDAQLEGIFGMLGKPEMLDAINRSGDIDYPSRLAWLLLRQEPGLLRYAGKFLRHGILGW